MGSSCPAPEESNEALRILGGMRGQVVDRGRISPSRTAQNGLCDEDGNVVYNVAQNCLVARGYPTNEEGLRQAMRDGYCSALKPEGGRIVLVTGDEAIQIWESAQTNASLSFPVKSGLNRLHADHGTPRRRRLGHRRCQHRRRSATQERVDQAHVCVGGIRRALAPGGG